MKSPARIIIPILLTIAILVCSGWYLLIYDREFTQDVLLSAARYFENQGNRSASTWFYNQAYKHAHDNDNVAIELANQYKSRGNYTKAEFTLTNAIAEGGGIDLYIALSQTYVEQDKLLDANRMLNNITNTEIKAQLEAMRPAPPICSPDPIASGSYYTQYITVKVSAASGTLYVNKQGLFPSTQTDLYNTDGITLVDGENTLHAIAVGENGLVSQPVTFKFTVGGVVKKIEFVDKAVEASIREILQFSDTKDIYTNELWGISEFTVPAGATSLEDLQHLLFLKVLKLENGPTGQLQYISDLSSLEEIYISNTPVQAAELPMLGRLPALKKLSLHECSLYTTAGLEQAKGLTHLDLSSNFLRNIEPLTGLQNLHTLILEDNALNTLLPLSGLNNLRVLNVASNQLPTLIPISTLTGLQELNASENLLSDLAGVDQLSNLQKLTVSNNTIADISPLVSNQELIYLDISSCSVVDISSLSSLNKLASLNFYNNRVTSLPRWEKNCALVSINGGLNLLSSVDALAGLQNLTSVYMRGNDRISSISRLADCPRLVRVDVYGTNVSKSNAQPLINMGVVVDLDPTVS